MQINPYSPTAVMAGADSADKLPQRTPVSPASLSRNPASIVTDTLEFPLPTDSTPRNPASVVNPGDVQYPQPINKSTLRGTWPIGPDSIVPGNEVHVLPWTGPNSPTVAPANPDSIANRDRFNPAALRETPSVRAELAKLKKASAGVESVILKDIVAKMRTSNGRTLFGSGFETAIHDDMLNEAIANKLSEAGGIGLSSAVYKNMESVVLRRAAALEYAKANPASIG